MKIKFLLLAAFLIPAIFGAETQNKGVVRAVRGSAIGTNQIGTLNDSLQKALYEEEANQDPETAALLYEDIIRRVEQQRRTAAVAHFRLGECYRKLGKHAEAAAQYDRVIKDYADIEQIAAQARAARSQPEMPKPAQDAAFQERLNTIIGTARVADPERARLQRIIENSPDLLNAPVTSIDSDNLTYLQNAARNGEIDSIKFLLNAGARPDIASSSTRKTALHFAAGAGHKTAVELLLEAGAQVNAASSRGETPLHSAARGGFLEVCKALLKGGANANATTFERETPLHSAARHGSTLVVELLLDAKAEVNAVEQSGFTPLMLAVTGLHKSTAELLLNRKADPNIIASMGAPTWSEGRSALSIAAGGAAEIIPTLLKHKADPNERSFPLHGAVATGNDQSIDLLLDAGADVNLQDKTGRTPLHWAVSQGRAHLLQKLLAHGADPNIEDERGRTPMLELPTVSESAPDILEMLLQAKANIWHKDDQQVGIDEMLRGQRGNPQRVQVVQRLDRVISEHLANSPATFEVREVMDSPGGDTVQMGLPTRRGGPEVPLLVSKTPLLTGAQVAEATAEPDHFSGVHLVRLTLTEEGATEFARITERHTNRRLAILLDGRLVAAPTIQEKIIGKQVQINGNFTPEEAKSFAERLNAGVKSKAR